MIRALSKIRNAVLVLQLLLPNLGHSLELAPQVKIPISIHIQDKVTLEKPRIYFSDFATCSGFKSKCDEILGIDFGSSPNPDQSLKIGCPTILNRVVQEIDNISVNIDCKTSAVIESAGSKISESEVETAVNSYLNAISKKGELEWRIKSINLPSTKIPKYLNRLVISEPLNLENTNMIQRVSSLDIQFQSEDAFVPALTVPIKVKIVGFEAVLYSSREIEKGESLTTSNTTWQMIEQKNAGLISKNDSVLGKLVGRKIAAGKIIRKNDITSDLHVKRGELVDIIVKSGALSLTSRAVSNQSGRDNENIEVTILKTKKKVVGKVVGLRTVEVSL